MDGTQNAIPQFEISEHGVISSMAGWKFPGHLEVEIAKKITHSYGPFSSTPCLTTGG